MRRLTFDDIPAEALAEINFMLGSYEECAQFLADLFRKHHHSERLYGFLSAEDDKALAVDVYKWLLDVGMYER